MKKFSKILSVALLVALVLSLGVTSAFADETTTTVSAPASAGSGAFTITMKSAEDGHIFKAYRIFDGSVATIDGKVRLGDIAWADGVVTSGIAADLAAAGLPTANGDKTLDLSKAQDVAEALTLQRDDSATMIKVADVFFDHKGTAVATATEKSGDNYVLGSGAVGSANAPLVAGYYLVTDEYANPDNVGEGAATLSRNILEVVGSVQAVVKNDKPSVEKKILNPNPVDANEAGIGDTVAFQITGHVPNYTGYVNYFYVINDTLSNGLTFDGVQNLVVKVGETTLTADDYVVYTGLDTSNGHTFEVAFKNIKGYDIGAAITVTYTATVNENAVIGSTGNPNETDVTYSNNPNDSQGGNPEENPKPDEDIPTGISVKDKTVTYVAELDLTKYKDKIDPDNLLAGATFTLTGTSNIVKGTGADIFVEDANGAYWKLTDGTYTTTAPHGDIVDADGNVKVLSNEASYESTDVKYNLQHVTTYEAGTEEIFMQGTSDQNGKIVFKGLGAGTYTLTEVVTPKGYNTAEPITFTIVITVPETIADGTEAATFSVTGTNQVTLSGADTDGKATTGLYLTSVIDNSGTVLPSTGGIGTTIFYVVGGVLVLAAIILLVTKKRMSE